MTYFGKQALTSRLACVNITYAFREGLFKRFYNGKTTDVSRARKEPHPYRSIHPWKSRSEFTKYLLDNLIYNEDGIVVLNKPYGVSAKSEKGKKREHQYRTSTHLIVKPVDYTIEECLPEIAGMLGYEKLLIEKAPDKHSSGVTILSGDNRLHDLMEKSVKRAVALQHLYRTFWTVTTMIPKGTHGTKRLGMKLKQFPGGNKKAIIVTQWSRNEVMKGIVKLLNVEFKVLATSQENSSSLLEVKTSTIKWHAVRLFAATQLFSPVLGDNYYGSSIRCVMGTWFPVKHYVDGTQEYPELNPNLLKILSMSKAQQEFIPVHMHLRSMSFPSLLKKGKDFVVEAPLLHPFDWTCKQLDLKPTLNSLETNVKDGQQLLCEN